LIYSIELLNGDEDGDIAEILIRGNGEECKVFVESTGVVVKTNCVKLTNSKQVQILCTKRKKMCKTVNEVVSFVNHGLALVQPKTYKNCLDNANNTYEMRTCNGNELKYQDALLNKYYKLAMQKLSKSEKDVLRKAQRAWIKYRDSKCDAAGEPMRGGTGEALLIGGCLVDTTKIRAKELREIALNYN